MSSKPLSLATSSSPNVSLIDDKTLFFYELTPEIVLRSVEKFGLLCTGRMLQLNSMENRVYEVEVETDEKTLKSPAERFRVVKFYRPGRWTREQILEEHEFLYDLVSNDISAVAPLRTVEGESLIAVGDPPLWCALFPKQGGRNPDELDSDQLAMLGRLLGRVHQVGASRQAQHRHRLTTTEFGEANVRFLVDSGLLPREFAPQYENLTGQIFSIASSLLESAPVFRIHGDCHAGNVLWNGMTLFLVDFDDMMVGPAIQDLWLLLPSRDRIAAEKLEVMLSGYEMFRPFDREELLLIEPLRALRYIHFSAWIGRRWKDPAFQRAFIHFGTLQYWREQVADLSEQLEIIAQGGFGSFESAL